MYKHTYTMNRTHNDDDDDDVKANAKLSIVQQFNNSKFKIKIALRY